MYDGTVDIYINHHLTTISQHLYVRVELPLPYLLVVSSDFIQAVDT